MNPCCPPFTQPCDACDEAEVHRAAFGFVQPWTDGSVTRMRRLASHAGVHPDDMTAFLSGAASLTPQNRRAIRERLRSADTPAQEPLQSLLSIRPVSADQPEPAQATEARRYVPRASDVPRSRAMSDGPPCGTCGDLTVRAGACYRCLNCGTTTGCG